MTIIKKELLKPFNYVQISDQYLKKELLNSNSWNHFVSWV